MKKFRKIGTYVCLLGRYLWETTQILFSKNWSLMDDVFWLGDASRRAYHYPNISVPHFIYFFFPSSWERVQSVILGRTPPWVRVTPDRCLFSFSSMQMASYKWQGILLSDLSNHDMSYPSNYHLPSKYDLPRHHNPPKIIASSNHNFTDYHKSFPVTKTYQATIALLKPQFSQPLQPFSQL